MTENPFPQNEDFTGKQVGQFNVLEEIGRGGMATVYRATQQSINRDVALKVLPRAFLHDPGFYERFVREVNVIAHLEHPHIVPIYDFGKHDGVPYIAMRYLAGGSLRALIRPNQQVPLKELVRPISQIAQALDHAHQQGIIHRDLKPGNVLLDTNQNAYLSDFGIARVINSDLTGSSIIGTPTYMSPEQAAGESLDARADIYSLGIVVFELITGREPFKASTPIAMILKHLNDRVPYLSEFRQGIPDSVDAVIAKSTEKNRDDRYPSAGAFADAFADAVRGAAASVYLGMQTTPQSESPTVTLSGEPPLPTEEMPLPKPVYTPNTNSPTVTPRDGVPAQAVAQRQASETPTPIFTKHDKDEATRLTNDIDLTPKPKGKPRRLPYGVLALLLLLLAGGYWGFTTLNTPANPYTLAPEPFTGADIAVVEVFDLDLIYTLSIPFDWFPDDTNYTDLSDVNRPVYHLWETPNENAAITVSALSTDRLQGLRPMMQDYAALYYEERTDLAPLGNPTIIDDVIRQSYRVTGSDEDFPAGQLDVFATRYADLLIVIETYSADSVGDDLNPTFQQILESFRLYFYY